jgi:hypothetical protein
MAAEERGIETSCDVDGRKKGERQQGVVVVGRTGARSTVGPPVELGSGPCVLRALAPPPFSSCVRETGQRHLQP